MNQILTTKPVKTRKDVNIKTVVLFFGISVIILGVFLTTSASYAIYQSLSSKPSIKNNTQSNQNEEEIDQSNSEIQIHLSVDGANIKATVVGETEISYVTYKWDEEDEIREDINSVSDEVIIEIPEGQHTLTITAVDINNNVETKEQQVKGIIEGSEETQNQERTTQTEPSYETESTEATKPKLEVTHDKEHSEFVIKASDEIGLDKFEFILNGQGYLVRVEGEEEKEFRYPLIEGDNTLEVTAYNTEGKTETFKALIHN